jgi:GH24 family phage-related lysozyme (muramidase)
MNIELCKAEIKRHEGEVLEIYNDSLGYKTLGVGHLCQPQDEEYDLNRYTCITGSRRQILYDRL